MNEIPTSLLVPLPGGFSGKRYGVYSMRHETAERVIFRIIKRDRDLIREIAELLNMSEAQFVRETAINMSKVIKKHMEEHNALAGDRSG